MASRLAMLINLSSEEYCLMSFASKLKKMLISFISVFKLTSNWSRLSRERFSPCWITSGIKSDITPRRVVTNIINDRLEANRLLNFNLFFRNNTMGRPINEMIAATIRYITKVFNWNSKKIPNEKRCSAFCRLFLRLIYFCYLLCSICYEFVKFKKI